MKIENAGMIAVAGWLVLGKARDLCARYTVLPEKRSISEPDAPPLNPAETGRA